MAEDTKDKKKSGSFLKTLACWIVLLAVFGVICMLFGKPMYSDYTVQPGDGWYRISRETEVPVDTLLADNNATLETPLYVGQKIRLRNSAWREITSNDGELYCGLLVANVLGSHLQSISLTIYPGDTFEVSCYGEETSKCLLACFKAAGMTPTSAIAYSNTTGYKLQFFTSGDSIICLR